MKRFIAFLTMLIVVATSYSQNGWRDHESEVKVKISNRNEAGMLYNLHLNGDIHPSAGYAIVYVIPIEIEHIKETGLTIEVLKNDLNEYYKNFWSDRAEQYHSYDQIITLIDSLATTFPGICKKTIFGVTPQGRQLTCLKISDYVTLDENEPEVLFDGGIHGDEIGGPENLIRFARYLCSSYGFDPEISDLVNSREIIIYPMVNPDGRANMSRYNSNFIDCNRDWGYMWDGEGNSPEAFSQPETRAMRSCIYNHRFVIHVSYHSGMEAVLYPWGFQAADPPDYPALSQLASVYSASSGYTDLQFGQSYADYPTNGETIDYSYGAGGTDALTMEISDNKQPPASQIQNYYQKNIPSMIEMIKNAGYGVEGTVTDSITGLPVSAAIFVNTFSPSYTDPAVGDYHKYLLPGIYSMKAVANNYLTKVMNNVVVTDEPSTIMNIQMHPATGHYATKIAAVVIPGNNSMDEANTPGMIGAPDSIFYSTGKNGWIIADMQDPMINIPGGDFTVYEGDAISEGYTCLAGQSADGPWMSLGNGTGTTTFDLASSGLTECRFIKIVDDGNGQQNVPDAGFDLDAIEALSPSTGIGIMAVKPGSMMIYPNPASETVTIATQSKAEDGTITIYNTQGQVMLTNQITNSLVQIDVKKLVKGFYFVKFSDENSAEVRKLIKE